MLPGPCAYCRLQAQVIPNLAHTDLEVSRPMRRHEAAGQAMAAVISSLYPSLRTVP